MASPATQFITRPAAEILGCEPGYGFAGLGVSTAIGNFTHTTTELLFPPGLLGLLDWRQTYNSLSAADEALGPGWSVALSARLDGSASGPVTFYDEDGRVLTFAPATGGGYLRPQDLAADLTRAADGSFTLAFSSGLVWSFDAAGRLTGRAMEGQRVSLDYDSGGLLVRASHAPTGRFLALAYDASGQLVTVTADDGRTVSLGYTSSALLASVTGPGGATARFGWSGTGEQAQLSSITDPAGRQVVGNSYDPQRRVSAQAFPGGGGATFSYDDAPGRTTVTFTPSGAQVTFQADAQGRMTRVTGPDGGAATFGYGPDGYLTQASTPGGTQLTQARDSRGNLLSSTFAGATTTWVYDDQDRPVRVTGPGGAVTSYRYDGDGRLPVQVTEPGAAVTQYTVAGGLITSRTDPDGGRTTFGYTTGNLSSVTGPDGQVTTFAYDTAGRRTSMTMPPSATTQYAYDEAGRLASITGPLGAQSSFQYSAAGDLAAVTNPTGAVTRYGYDEAGHLTTITDPLGRVLSFGYDPDGNLTTATDPAGNRATLGYDQLARLASVTYPDGTEVSYGYDADGNQVTSTGPAGTSQVRFDGAGRPTQITDVAGVSASYNYDTAGRLTAVTGPDSQTWQTEYDAAGNPVLTTDPLGGQIRQTWSPGGHVTSVTDAEGRQVSYSHDPAGRVVSVTNGEGGVTRYAYDQQGRRISVTTPAGLVTRFRYDLAGRLAATVNARGWATHYEYDANGRKTAVITPSGAATRYRYDSAGQLTEIIGPDGATVRYAYDGTGKLTSATSPRGTVTQFGYDSLGRLTSVTDPLGRTTRHEYDQTGNLTATIDPDGHAQHFTYSPTRLLLSHSADDGTAVSFRYDQVGRRVSMTDGTGTTRYAYDAAGRLTSVTDPDGEVTTASYNQAGQRTGLTYPGGLAVSYSYDLNGRLIGMTDSRAGSVTYILDPDGRLLTEQLPRRMARHYRYDGGLVRGFSSYRDDHPVGEAVFSRGPDGGIIGWRDEEHEREYGYDPAGQLSQAALWAGGRDRAEWELAYDPAGNRVRLRRDGTEVHYRYDDAGQLAATESEGRHTEYTYDSAGRLTEVSAEGYRRNIRYDGFSRPAEVTRSAGPVTERIQATYNGDDLLVALSLRVIDERHEEEGRSSVRYRWGSVNQIPEIFAQRADPELDRAGDDRPGRLSADFSYGYGRTFASWPDGHAVIAHDAFGSAVRTEDTEAWAQARQYTPFGAPEDTPGPERGDGPPNPELPRFGYRGELALGSMIYLRARVYDAEIGRFITPDPLSQQTGGANPVHPYVYADNDPLNLADPLGTLPVTSPDALMAGFVPKSFVDPGASSIGQLLRPPTASPAPAPPGPSPQTLKRLQGDLRSNNFGDISRLLHINPALLFPMPKPPPTHPELVGRNQRACANLGIDCGQVVQVPTYHNDNTPVSLGMQWLAGVGPRDQYFNQYDPFTQMLRQDANVAETRQQIQRDLKAGGPYTDKHNYQDPRTPAQFLKDMSGVFGIHLPGVTPSNPADGFLGSYSLNWAAVPYTGSQATAFFTVTNTSDLDSFAHPEITAPWMIVAGVAELPAGGALLILVGVWALTHSNDIDGLLPSRQWPGGTTTQKVQWQETITY
jgi:RHS repeat-associated protein